MPSHTPKFSATERTQLTKLLKFLKQLELTVTPTSTALMSCHTVAEYKQHSFDAVNLCTDIEHYFTSYSEWEDKWEKKIFILADPTKQEAEEEYKSIFLTADAEFSIKDPDEVAFYYRGMVNKMRAQVQLARDNLECQQGSSGGSSASSSTTPTTHSLLPLPPIALPKFDGAFWKWHEYWEQFNTLVHSDINMHTLHKFAHLKSTLSSSALACIANLPMTAETYNEAVDILKRTFHRPLQAIIQIDSQIYKAKTSSQSVPAQLALADSLKPLLKEYQRVDEHCTSTFQLMLLRKFDASVQSMILDHFDEAGKINTEEMLSLIEAKLIRDSAIASGLNELQSARASDSSKCAFCDRSHSSSLCRTYPSADERKDVAFKKHLCLRCLQTGHDMKSCSATCAHCSGAHHPSLCSNKYGTSSSNDIRNRENRGDYPLRKRDRSPKAHTSHHYGVAYVETHFEGDDPDKPFTLRPDVRLMLAEARMKGRKGTSPSIEALLDCGGTTSVISRDILPTLRYRDLGTETITLTGIGNVSVTKPRQTVEVYLKLLDGSSHTVQAVVLDEAACDMKASPLSNEDEEYIKSKNLAPALGLSKRYWQPKLVLAGSDFFKLTQMHDRHDLPSGMTLFNTALGHISAGQPHFLHSKQKHSKPIKKPVDSHRDYLKRTEHSHFFALDDEDDTRSRRTTTRRH